MKMPSITSFLAFENLEDEVGRCEKVMAVLPDGDDRFLLFTDAGRVIRVSLRHAGGFMYADCDQAVDRIAVKDTETKEWDHFDYYNPMPNNFMKDANHD